MKNKNYINLTNGIEKIPELNNYSFIRIQSTTIERKDWIKLLQDLDHDFLLHLVLGFNVNVYDYGTNREYSKTIYYGLPLIEYCLNRFWFDIIPEKVEIYCRNGNLRVGNFQEYFNQIYNQLFIYDRNKEKERLITKLKYYKKFINCNKITLNGFSQSTNNDGNYPYYFNLLKQYYVEDML